MFELEGTWEEIVAQSDKLVGRRVRVIVLSDKPVWESHEVLDLPDVRAEIRKKIQEIAASGGNIIEPPLKGKIEPVSEEELEKLAEEIGKMPGKLLSEIAIEQRGPW